MVAGLALLPWAPGAAVLSAQVGLQVAAPPTPHEDLARADRLYVEMEGPSDAASVLAILAPDVEPGEPPELPPWDRLAAVGDRAAAADLASWMRGVDRQLGGTAGELGDRDVEPEGVDAEPGVPTHPFERRWRAARLALGLGIMAEDWEARSRWHRWGILWSLEALALEPPALAPGAGTEGLFWLAAHVGRYALHSPSDPERARAADAAFRLAQRILERDPDHAGAHNVLGRSHLEVRRLPVATRLLARAFMGREFVSRTSWDGARHHLARAVELDPGLAYFRLDLALYHRARGNGERFQGEVEALLALPRRHPIDPWLADEMRRFAALPTERGSR